jgi:integrase
MFSSRLESLKEYAPKELLHWNNKLDAVTTAIQDFKRTAAKDPFFFERLAKNAEVAANIIGDVNYKIDHRFDTLQEDILEQFNQVRELIKAKRKKVKRQTRPLRMPADKTILQFLLNLKRPKKQHRVTFARNRIAVALLFSLGLRANELRQINQKLLREGLTQGRCALFQTKTNQYRILVFPQYLKDLLKNQLASDIKVVFQHENDMLLSSVYNKDSNIRKDSWIKSLNIFLKFAQEHFQLENFELTSHSFRANYVTTLLRTVPIHQVKTIVGHKSIETTARYDRYHANTDQIKAIVDKAFT